MCPFSAFSQLVWEKQGPGDAKELKAIPISPCRVFCKNFRDKKTMETSTSFILKVRLRTSESKQEI